MEIFETPLPGLGVRYEFATVAGDRLGLVVRRDGRRELVLYDDDDRDSCRETVMLTSAEAATLVELLGGTKITERISDLRHQVEGLSIEWVTMPAGRGLTGKAIGEGQVRTRPGASVVAVIRGQRSIPGPEPGFVFEVGDVALLVGSVDGVQSAVGLLTR